MRKLLLICCTLLVKVAAAQPLREIDAAGVSFRGLSFLDTLLQGKRIVMLGESSHGTEQYSQVKGELVRYLQEKLGYNVLLFESPMAACSYLPLTKDTSAALRVRASLQSFWHTRTVTALFQYAQQHGLMIGGFDPQFVRSPYPKLFYAAAMASQPALVAAINHLETRVDETYTNPKFYLSLRDSFSTVYSQVAKQMEQMPLSPLQQWVHQLMAVNSHYYAGITIGEERDHCMAANIIWLADNLYKNDKIIIWAHNTHIDKVATTPRRIMGKMLADHFKAQLYGIGLFMANGSTALYPNHVITVKPPLKGLLEAYMLQSGYRTTFAESSDPFFRKPVPTWHWGKEKQRMAINRSFDAVILVNGVSAPGYLP